MTIKYNGWLVKIENYSSSSLIYFPISSLFFLYFYSKSKLNWKTNQTCRRRIFDFDQSTVIFSGQLKENVTRYSLKKKNFCYVFFWQLLGILWKKKLLGTFWQFFLFNMKFENVFFKIKSWNLNSESMLSRVGVKSNWSRVGVGLKFLLLYCLDEFYFIVLELQNIEVSLEDEDLVILLWFSLPLLTNILEILWYMV